MKKNVRRYKGYLLSTLRSNIIVAQDMLSIIKKRGFEVVSEEEFKDLEHELRYIQDKIELYTKRLEELEPEEE